MPFADAAGRNRLSTEKDVVRGLDSPETGLRCTRRIHSPRKCFVGCVAQEQTLKGSFMRGVSEGLPLGSTPM